MTELQNQSLLQDSDAFVALVENSGIAGIWIWNLESDCMEWSDATWRLFGLNRSEHTPSFKLLDANVHPDDLSIIAEIRQLNSTARAPHTFRFLRPDGTMKCLETLRALVYGASGEPIVMRGIVIDVTAREEARRALQRDRSHILTLARELGAFFWRAAPDGRLNKTAWLDWYKELESPALRDDIVHRFHPRDRAAVEQSWQAAVEENGLYRGMARLRSSDGRYRTHYLAATPPGAEDETSPTWAGLAVVLDLPQLSVTDADIIPGQIMRAARALLDWSAEDLAQNAGVSASTVRRIEDGTAGRLRGDARARVYEALVRGGVSFAKGFDGQITMSGRQAVRADA